MIKSGSLITFGEVKNGIMNVSLNINELYQCQNEKEQFLVRLRDFLNSDPANKNVIKLENDFLFYKTEQIIPEKTNDKPPLLLLLGNPASHSVEAEMFFAFEANGKEHRFWKALERSGILSFTSDAESISELFQINQLRKRELYELSYILEFCIGMAVFYSMPSSASGSWAGVAGLRKLFRKKALLRIGEYEKTRVEELIRKFVFPHGAVIAFQKDAYEGIKSSTSPVYNINEAKKGKLVGNCQHSRGVRLFCCPPTYQMLWEESLVVLCNFKKAILTKG